MPDTPAALVNKRTSPGYRLRLDLDAWDRACDRRGYRSDREAAKALRIRASTISRLRSRQCTPGGPFVATVLATWRTETFVDLFEIVEVA